MRSTNYKRSKAKPNGQKRPGDVAEARRQRKERLDKNKAVRAAEKSSNTRIHEAGMTGVDPRSDASTLPSSAIQDVQAVGSTTTLEVTVTTTDRSIAYLAMGIMLRALRNGSEAAQINQEYPYFQFLYLIDVFTTVMETGVIKLTAAPQWMWELIYALKPKVGKVKNAFVNYNWDIKASGVGLDQQFALGSGSNIYSIFWGTEPTGASVNGFPVLGAISSPYTEDLGLAAISALWPYVTPRGEALHADPGPTGVSTSADTSAFAVVYPELGESYFAQGALRTTLYSERHIDAPIFSQFAQYQPTGGPAWRGWHQAKLGSGSPSAIGPYLIDNASSLKQIKNKQAPVVKFYNFDEFFEQLSLTMCLAGESQAKAGQVVQPCPLTPQQVQILLRQTLLQVFSNDYCQDVRLTGSSYVDMLPFTVGPNGTNSGATVGMQLPTFLAENIRACASRTAKLSKKYDTNNVKWIPILARPCQQPQLGNYSYVNNGTSLIYNTDPAEVPINIIDMSAQVGMSTVFLDVTRDEIQVLLNLWNEWIIEFTNVMSPLVTVTTEKGIKALNCNNYSNIVEEIPPIVVVPPLPATATDVKARKLSSEKPKKVGTDLSALRRRIGAAPVVGSSYMENVGERRIVSGVGFDAALDQIYTKWILPVNYSTDGINDASTQGYQTFQIELASKSRSSSGGIGSNPNEAFRLPNSLQRHLNAASVDVKAFATTDQQNETIMILLEVAKLGRGGFLSSALSSIAGAFNPDWGKAVNTWL